MVAVRMADENDLDKSNGKAVEPFWNAHTPERSTVDAVRTGEVRSCPICCGADEDTSGQPEIRATPKPIKSPGNSDASLGCEPDVQSQRRFLIRYRFRAA